MPKIESFLLEDEKERILKLIKKEYSLTEFCGFVDQAFRKKKNECLGYDLMKLARCINIDSPSYFCLKTFFSGNEISNQSYESYFTYLKKYIDWGKYTVSDVKYNMKLIEISEAKNIPLLYTFKQKRNGIYYCILISKSHPSSYFMIEKKSISYYNKEKTRGYVKILQGQIREMKHDLLCYFVKTSSSYF